MNDGQGSSVQDRLDVSDAIYRYASCIDVRDMAGLRRVLADDIWAQYGDREPMSGGDNVAAWIDSATVDCIWQHHLLSVYHVDVDGDRAKALVYHTSHQRFHADPDAVRILVGRYRDELTRTPSGWRISRLQFEICWADRRPDTADPLARSAGRGQGEDQS